VLLLCDVLGWSAAEVAALLGGSVASVNSALQRARESLAKRQRGSQQPAAPALNLVQQELLGRYVRAWEGFDLDGFVSLLREDATYTMPPLPQWYSGRDAIHTFFKWAWKLYGGFRLVSTAANGQPAFAAYSRAGTDGPWTAHSLQVLSLERDGISALTLFFKPDSERLFQSFGLPLVLPDSSAAQSRPAKGA
jgi:RNA polymerase sigma-70 factor (ECF subfamily)